MHNDLSADAIKVLSNAKNYLSDTHNISFDISDIDAAIKLRSIVQKLDDNILKSYYATFIREVQNSIEHEPLSDIASGI